MNYHLVILKKKYLDLILSGEKTVESRFTRTRKEPFGSIDAGDRLFLKYSSGPVCAVAKVKRAENFENLTTSEIRKLKKLYNHLIRADSDYWKQKRKSKVGVLVWIDGVKPIEPFDIDKKDWRAWVVLSKKKDFGLLKKARTCFG